MKREGAERRPQRAPLNAFEEALRHTHTHTGSPNDVGGYDSKYPNLSVVFFIDHFSRMYHKRSIFTGK